MDQFGNDSFEQNEDDAALHRGGSRDSLFLTADMRVGDSTRSETVRVRNLSPGGLMAEYPRGLDQGTAIELEVRGLGPVPGRVAWSAAGRIGVAFDRLIDPLQARKPIGGATRDKASRPLQLRR